MPMSEPESQPTRQVALGKPFGMRIGETVIFADLKITLERISAPAERIDGKLYPLEDPIVELLLQERRRSASITLTGVHPEARFSEFVVSRLKAGMDVAYLQLMWKPESE